MLLKDDVQKLLNNIGLGLEELKMKSDGLFKIVNPKFNGKDVAQQIGTINELIEYLRQTNIIKCYMKCDDGSGIPFSDLYSSISIKNPFYGNTIEQMQIKADLM